MGKRGGVCTCCPDAMEWECVSWWWVGGGAQSLLEGQGEFARLRLFTLVAPEVGEELAHKAADFPAGNVESSQAADEIPRADRGHALLRILHLLRPDHLPGSVMSSLHSTRVTWPKASKLLQHL